jgi:hypothetical protein
LAFDGSAAAVGLAALVLLVVPRRRAAASAVTDRSAGTRRAADLVTTGA